MDIELFWKLLEPHHPKAAAFCIKLAGDRDDGQDLYQDALLKAIRRLDSLADSSAFRPWLFRIIVNSYKNRCRRWWRRQRISLSPNEHELPSGEDFSSQLDARRKLDRLLAVLSPLDRALVILHEIEGWPTAELAEMLGKPEGTIKTRIFRARAKMRDRVRRINARRSARNETVSEVAYAMQQSQKAAD